MNPPTKSTLHARERLQTSEQSVSTIRDQLPKRPLVRSPKRAKLSSPMKPSSRRIKANMICMALDYHNLLVLGSLFGTQSGIHRGALHNPRSIYGSSRHIYAPQEIDRRYTRVKMKTGLEFWGLGPTESIPRNEQKATRQSKKQHPTKF